MSKKDRFIFLTHEGYTFQPNSSAVEPDVDNLQVVGFAEGSDAGEAFEILLSENPYLKETTFDKVHALRFVSEINEMYSNEFFIQSY